ncbi:replication factor C subunit 1 [Pimephales promelas]|uniref:replication factor C subunit 1 n=1 Tax=Pimephales promelas TaxID=90988 RepID=UPI001955C796|nr:replication factor C subunit 1 [Pimephales promelas]KAG1956767.1 replication factor C subunit [Pimephales promelas]KAG1956768.1 replication factor C subunit [Pimephales promelas]
MDIRRFFASTKPSNESTSTDEEQKKKQKSKTKIKSPKSDEKPTGKRKKRVIIDSDSEEDKKEKKTKKSTKETPAPTVKKQPVTFVSDSDSDDTFVTLKPHKPKENGTAKGKEVSNSGKAKQAKVSPKRSPIKSPNTTSKPSVKSSQPIVSTKVTPTPPKLKPTTVMAFFGSSSVQRSEKKMVASTSTKRKAPTQEIDESLSDEAIAKELQMDEEIELEKQIHDDEEFAKTLAMLDEAPLPKKARVDSISPSKSSCQAVASDTKPKKDPSPKTSPVKTSSKLAQMKKRQDEEDEQRKRGEKKMKISPKKEPISPACSEQAATPKTGSVSTGMTKSRSISTPKSEPSKTSPTKPENTSPEDLEKKRANSSAYRNFLNREGPRALGSKEIPQGAENCLEGCVFVLTGVLESMERDDAKSLIERYGGKVTGNVSRKTNYLVLGRDSGVSKTEKAESFGTKIINEDELLELIRTKPGKKSKYEIAAEAENKSSKTRTPDSRGKPTPPAKKATPQGPSPNKRSPSERKSKPGSASKSGTREASRSEVKKSLSYDQTKTASPVSHSTPQNDGSSLLWVDKYRPRSLKNLIGQQGDQSCANKLLRWLQHWHKHHSGNTKAPPKFGKFGSKDDGSGFKAALLSGPPGVGKTTTAALVCEELGYSYVEMNASCTRSKNSLKEVIAESLNNTSIKNFYTGASQTVSSKHVLIMDEVDGMAGNEDRGGIQEMIGLIKQSKIPIICMCNDRNHQKIRSLANYCYDLRFQRPRVEQIKGAMMSIAFKEGLKIPPPALNEVILASNQDIRQILHNLCMWSAKDKVMTYDQAKADAKNAKKDMKLGPFDVCRKVFASGEETAHMSLIDKSDLFFHDYSLAPLFVQENYLHVRPAAAGGNLKNHLVLLSKTADSICDGDLVDKQIRSKQTWSLLPTQAIYASVLPGELMRGYMSQFPTFPSWLGKFSSAGKHSRIIQELASHMSLKTLSSKEAINLDYLPYLRSAILEPLQSQGSEGANQSVKLMDDYDIIKEDVDNMMEISTWGGQSDPYSKLDSKVKAAFTRAYNKESHLTPYSLQVVKKSRKGAVDPELVGELDDESQVQEEEENDGLTRDAMIKQKKAKPAKDVKQEKPGASGKGKGRGKGKAKN